LAPFNAVKIDPEVHTQVLPDGVDLDPATLHDRPECVDALTGRARRRGLTSAQVAHCAASGITIREHEEPGTGWNHVLPNRVFFILKSVKFAPRRNSL
jgi:hypothetical protein